MRASQIRRSCIALLMAALCCGPALARERPATTPAAQFLQETIDRAFALARPPVSAEAGTDLAALIERSMDWPALTRFAIGRYGATLDKDGMNAVTESLEQHMEMLARRAGTDLSGTAIAIRDMRIDPDGHRRILSTAAVPRFGDVEVEWTLVPSGTGYRIADIKALGLSLRQFLRGWVSSLVAARGGDAAAAFGEGAAASPQ
jgi:ABC-type transporter MlaC component